MVADVTVAFIAHDEFDLMCETVPHNLRVLSETSSVNANFVLMLDGSESNPSTYDVSQKAFGWGIDEVRIRSRMRNCAKGDGANNPHVHLFCDKSKYLVSIEADVAIFPTHKSSDMLESVVKTFSDCPNLPILTKIDDHRCWAWQMTDVGPPFAPGVRSVNRVSSHFLAYDVDRARKWIPRSLDGSMFHDNGVAWFNYEDYLSTSFAAPEGPGIGYAEALPAQIFHCDIKVAPGSPFYSKDIQIKLAEFRRIKRDWLASVN